MTRSSKPANLELLKSANWLAVYTSPRHEKSVSRHFEYRGIESFLPLYKVNRKWSDGSRVTVELPLFTGYLFVKIARTDRCRVLDVPGVVALVSGTGGEPAVISEVTIEALRRGVAEGVAEPHPLLTVGQRVLICSGPLTGMEGVLIRNKNSLRVIVTVEQLMRSIAVEVPASMVSPVEAELPVRDRASYAGRNEPAMRSSLRQ